MKPTLRIAHQRNIDVNRDTTANVPVKNGREIQASFALCGKRRRQRVRSGISASGEPNWSPVSRAIPIVGILIFETGICPDCQFVIFGGSEIILDTHSQ